MTVFTEMSAIVNSVVSLRLPECEVNLSDVRADRKDPADAG